MNQYEAMFLFDPTFGSTLEKCEEEIRRLMDRAEAEIIICKKWDERRLAYKIKGRKRGVYVIVFFNAPPGNIVKLERDSKLAENVLRMLVLRAEGMSAESMEKASNSGSGSQVTPSGDGAPSKEKTEDKPAASGESKPADAAAKDGVAKDGAAKDATAKDSAAKETAATDGAATDSTASASPSDGEQPATANSTGDSTETK